MNKEYDQPVSADGIPLKAGMTVWLASENAIQEKVLPSTVFFEYHQPDPQFGLPGGWEMTGSKDAAFSTPCDRVYAYDPTNLLARRDAVEKYRQEIDEDVSDAIAAFAEALDSFAQDLIQKFQQQENFSRFPKGWKPVGCSTVLKLAKLAKIMSGWEFDNGLLGDLDEEDEYKENPDG